ncbi:MAG: tetratricopeptide repeat protein [Prosthecobacter sp.]
MPPADPLTLLAESKAAIKVYDHERALALCEQSVAALRAGEPCYALVNALLTQADALRLLSRYDESEAVFQELLPLAERLLGEGNALTRFVMNCWAILCKYTGRFDQGAALYQRSLALAQKAGVHDRHEMATLYHNIAGLEHARKEYAVAEPYARRSVEIRRRVSGPDSVDVTADEAALASILIGLKKYDEAEEINRRALTVFEREHGPVHYEVAVTCNNLGTILQSTGRVEEALPYYERALAIKEKLQGADHVDVGITLNNLGLLHQSQGRPEMAAPLYQRALDIFEAKLPADHPNIEVCRENLEGLAVTTSTNGNQDQMTFARPFWELWNLAMADATDENAVTLLQKFASIRQHLLEGRSGCGKSAQHWKRLRGHTVWKRVKTADDARLWLWHAHNLSEENTEPVPYSHVAAQFSWPEIVEDEARKRADRFFQA